MAWTTTKKSEFAAGNHKIQLWELNADSATLELKTGLGVIDHAQLTPASGAASAASFGWQVKLNQLSANTASNGYVSVTGAASGNKLLLAVWGH